MIIDIYCHVPRAGSKTRNADVFLMELCHDEGYLWSVDMLVVLETRCMKVLATDTGLSVLVVVRSVFARGHHHVLR
jgi:hypothetical protein